MGTPQIVIQKPDGDTTVKLRHVLAVLGGISTVAAFVSALVFFLGGEIVSPGKVMAKLREDETQMNGRMTALEVHVDTQAQITAMRFDSLFTIVRPLTLNLCLRASPRDIALMNVDCDSLLRTAALDARWRRSVSPSVGPRP